jgi:hypothetical protein
VISGLKASCRSGSIQVPLVSWIGAIRYEASDYGHSLFQAPFNRRHRRLAAVHECAFGHCNPIVSGRLSISIEAVLPYLTTPIAPASDEPALLGEMLDDSAMVHEVI